MPNFYAVHYTQCASKSRKRFSWNIQEIGTWCDSTVDGHVGQVDVWDVESQESKDVAQADQEEKMIPEKLNHCEKDKLRCLDYCTNCKVKMGIILKQYFSTTIL